MSSPIYSESLDVNNSYGVRGNMGNRFLHHSEPRLLSVSTAIDPGPMGSGSLRSEVVQVRGLSSGSAGMVPIINQDQLVPRYRNLGVDYYGQKRRAGYRRRCIMSEEVGPHKRLRVSAERHVHRGTVPVPHDVMVRTMEAKLHRLQPMGQGDSLQRMGNYNLDTSAGNYGFRFNSTSANPNYVESLRDDNYPASRTYPVEGVMHQAMGYRGPMPSHQLQQNFQSGAQKPHAPMPFRMPNTYTGYQSHQRIKEYKITSTRQQQHILYHQNQLPRLLPVEASHVNPRTIYLSSPTMVSPFDKPNLIGKNPVRIVFLMYGSGLRVTCECYQSLLHVSLCVRVNKLSLFSLCIFSRQTCSLSLSIPSLSLCTLPPSCS
ncbi:hypothetical protein AAMO2058_000784100 [Amorphochlora amoebiformis]